MRNQKPIKSNPNQVRRTPIRFQPQREKSYIEVLDEAGMELANYLI